jgi:hypothetical protein
VKRVDICDVCGKKWPAYHFRYKFWNQMYTILEVRLKRYDICDDCFEELKRMVQK